MSDYQREIEFDRGISTYWDTDMGANDPGFKSKDIGLLEKWGPTLSGLGHTAGYLGKGFLDQYLDKSSKYQDQAGSSFDTQKKAEDVAKGTAAGWSSHELGSNFTALTPPVMRGGGGQDQPFVIGGGQQAGGQSTAGRIAGSALSGLGTYGALAMNPVTAPFAVAGGIVSGLGSLFG